MGRNHKVVLASYGVCGQFKRNPKPRDHLAIIRGLNRTDERLGLILEGVSVISKDMGHFVKNHKFRDLSCKYYNFTIGEDRSFFLDGNDEHGHDGAEHGHGGAEHGHGGSLVASWRRRWRSHGLICDDD